MLRSVEFAINNSISRSTGKCPSELLFGVPQRGEITDRIRLMMETKQDIDRDLEKLRSDASESISRLQESNEQVYNHKRKAANLYKVGDYVMIKNIDNTVGVNKKLIPQFKGPYTVSKVLERDRYVIKDIDEFQITQLPYDGIISTDRLKPYLK